MKSRKERFYKVPLCEQECNLWWNDCRNDFTCVKNWETDFNWATGTFYHEFNWTIGKKLYREFNLGDMWALSSYIGPLVAYFMRINTSFQWFHYKYKCTQIHYNVHLKFFLNTIFSQIKLNEYVIRMYHAATVTC